MNTQEAIEILSKFVNCRDWGLGCDLQQIGALTHAIEHMKRGAPDYDTVDRIITNVFGKEDQFEMIDRGNLQAFVARVYAAPEPPQERKD